MSTARNQIGKKAMEVMHDLQEMREAAQDVAGEDLEQSPETDLYCEQGPENVLRAKCSMGQFIRQRPIKSVLIALGAGVLLGSFWTIRRR